MPTAGTGIARNAKNRFSRAKLFAQQQEGGSSRKSNAMVAELNGDHNLQKGEKKMKADTTLYGSGWTPLNGRIGDDIVDTGSEKRHESEGILQDAIAEAKTKKALGNPYTCPLTAMEVDPEYYEETCFGCIVRGHCNPEEEVTFDTKKLNRCECELCTCHDDFLRKEARTVSGCTC